MKLTTHSPELLTTSPTILGSTTPGFDQNYRNTQFLTITTLSKFSRCPRAYFYSQGCGLRTEEHIALKYGEALHAAFPYAHLQDIDRAIAAFQTIWEDQEGDEKRNSTNAILVLHNYMASHAGRKSIFTLQPPPKGIPEIDGPVSPWEIPYVLDIGLPVPLMGRVDGLCRHRDTGELWALEYKTTSEMSSRFFGGFVIHPQVIGYTLALRSYGLDVKGAIVEGILSSKTRQDESSQPFPVSDTMVSDFLTWIRYTGSMLLKCEELKTFPKDVSACTTYPQHGAPGYQCDFLSACTVPNWTIFRDHYNVDFHIPFKLKDQQDGDAEHREPTEPTTSSSIPIPIPTSIPNQPIGPRTLPKPDPRFIRIGTPKNLRGTE